MDVCKDIERMIAPILQRHEVQLYSISFRKENGMRVLQIAIMYDDGTMDLDTCAAVSEEISACLDETDPIDEEYYLEVCSVGAERPLTNDDQIHNALGQYVHVDLKQPVKGNTQWEGYLKDDANGELVMEYMDKAVRRTIILAKEDIQAIRLAVKC